MVLPVRGSIHTVIVIPCRLNRPGQAAKPTQHLQTRLRPRLRVALPRPLNLTTTRRLNMSAMNMPGFSAEASVYKVARCYYRTSGRSRASAMRGVVGPAGACSCTDPGCTWTCPVPPPPYDPCNRCRRLSGCAQKRCFCECDGGICHGECCQACE